MLLKYGANSLAGHDHCAFVFKEDNDLGQNSFHIVVGNSDKGMYSSKRENMYPEPLYGLSSDNNPTNVYSSFGSLVAKDDMLTMSVHDQDANVLYSVEAQRRKL